MDDLAGIYYPHYCYSCVLAWIDKERMAPCPRCKSKMTVNCYREKGEDMTEKRKCMHLECDWPAVPYSDLCIRHRVKSSFSVEELEEQNQFMIEQAGNKVLDKEYE